MNKQELLARLGELSLIKERLFMEENEIKQLLKNTMNDERKPIQEGILSDKVKSDKDNLPK